MLCLQAQAIEYQAKIRALETFIHDLSSALRELLEIPGRRYPPGIESVLEAAKQYESAEKKALQALANVGA